MTSHHSLDAGRPSIGLSERTHCWTRTGYIWVWFLSLTTWPQMVRLRLVCICFYIKMIVQFPSKPSRHPNQGGRHNPLDPLDPLASPMLKLSQLRLMVSEAVGWFTAGSRTWSPPAIPTSPALNSWATAATAATCYGWKVKGPGMSRALRTQSGSSQGMSKAYA